MKTSLHSLALAAAAASLIPCSVNAQTAAVKEHKPAASTPEKEDDLPVVVTATRTSVALQDAPQRIEIIPAQEISRTPARELADLLDKTANVDIKQYPGGLSAVSMRGFSPVAPMTGESMQTLVLLNGMPMIANALSTVPVDGIAQVEALRGPASALYGSQAMAGVINLVPVRRTGSLQGGIGLDIGSFKKRGGQANIGGALNSQFNFDYFGSFYKQGNYKYPGGTAENSGLRKDSHSLRLGIELAPQWSMDIRGDWFRGKDMENPGALPEYSGTPSVKNMQRDLYSLALRGGMQNHLLSATVYFGKEKSKLYDLDAQDIPVLSFDSRMTWQGVQLKDEWEWGPGNQLVYGFDHSRTKAQSVSYWGGAASVYQPDSKLQNNALYAQQNFKWNEGKTNFYLGARYDWFKVSTLSTALLPGNIPQSRNFRQFNPSIGVRHYLTPMVALHATAGRGFAAPSAWKLAGDYKAGFARYRGNPDLKPESSVTADVGVSLERNNWNADVTFYDTRVKDKVITTYLPDGITSWANAHKARMYGMEFSGRWAISPHMGVNAGYTWSIKAQENSTGRWKDLQYVPEHALRVALDGQWGSWSGRLGARYTGKTRKTAYFSDWSKPPKESLYGGYTLWDTSIRYQVAKQHSIALSVDNLFDKYHASVPGYVMPGREISLSYRWDFQ